MKSAVLRLVANGMLYKDARRVRPITSFWMPLHDEVVTEKYQHVDLSLGYHATDLEITAERR